jgi:TolA-binding protein
MSEHGFPEISSAVLRDNAAQERVERIWKRLEGDLTTSDRRPRSALMLLPAAAVLLFGLGVFVGARWQKPEPQPLTALAPEPMQRAEPSLAGPPGQPRVERTRQPERAVRPPVNRAEAEAPVEELSAEPPPLTLEPVPAPEPINLVAPPAPLSAPAWQRLFDQGEFDAARRELARQGGFAAGFDTALSLAVQSGQRARAIEALRRVVDFFGGDPVAPRAAYKLGNLLEKMGDRAGAAEAFAHYRRLSPTGDLAEDALARQVGVAIERGDLERARQLADQYAKDFPNGRRLSDIRDRLQKLSGTVAAESGDAGAPSSEELPAEEPQDDDGDRAK